MRPREAAVFAGICIVILFTLAGCSSPATDNTTTIGPQTATDGTDTPQTEGDTDTTTDGQSTETTTETETDSETTTSNDDTPEYATGEITTMSVEMPQFDNRTRTVRVYTPPGYFESDRSYPVVYMQDGQNLFDNSTAYNEEWQVDETMDRLAHEADLAAIVVGVDNGGSDRITEYTPPELGPTDQTKHGDRYAAFLAETVKPLIDETYRTQPDQAAIMGSSLGGSISVYTAFEYPDTFPYVAGLSTGSPPADVTAAYLNETGAGPERVYMDWGLEEGPRPEMFAQRNQAFATNIQNLGYEPGQTLLTVTDEDGGHGESAWRERFPRAVQWVLTGEDPAA
mgnify:CR=1 FL=1